MTPGGTGERGGMGRLAAAVAEHWRAADLRPRLTVVDPYGRGGWARSAWRLPRAMRHIARLHARGEAGLLHVHVATRGSVFRKAALVAWGRRLGLPVVLTIHTGDFMDYVDRLPRLVGALVVGRLRAAHLVALLAGAWRERVAGLLDMPADRLRHVPNGIAWRPPDPPPSATPCRLLFLGRLVDEKGLPELVDALARLAGSPAWTARLAGRGAIAAVRAAIDARGLSGRVTVEPWLDADDARRALAGADVLMLPSRAEGAPIALLEAMASGRAIVASAVDAVPEMVTAGEHALLVPPRDVPALADALARVIADPALRVRLGAAAARRFDAEFRIERHCAALQALYAEADAGVRS